MRITVALAVAFLTMTGLSAASEAQATVRKPTNIAPQALRPALHLLSKERDFQVIFRTDVVADLKTQGVSGELTVDEALTQLLTGTGLTYRYLDDKTITVVPQALVTAGANASSRRAEEGGLRGGEGKGSTGSFHLARAQGEEEKNSKEEDNGSSLSKESKEVDEYQPEASHGVPEILVRGSRILNVDIRCSENDIQPYVVFDHEEIANSGAINLEDFFKNQLTMNLSAVSSLQTTARTSRINLRGLGTDETLILVDGRRISGTNQVALHSVQEQPDISGIPLAAIERIEVLPTTASGIYGGNATGGVINIVLRRSYSGFETSLSYGNSFESDVARRQVLLSGGFTLEGGATNVTFTGSYSDANSLLLGERDFAQRKREHILATNPSFYFNSSSPPFGATPNIRSSNGSNLTLDNGTPLNAPITFIPYGYAGTSTDAGAALVPNAGSYNFDPPNTAQSEGRRATVLGGPETKSVMVTLRREFASWVQVFVDLQANNHTHERFVNRGATARIPASAPNNPFQQAIIVRVPTVGLDRVTSLESDDERITGGAIFRLSREWQVATDFTWNRSRFSYNEPGNISPATIAALNDGTLDILRDISQFPVTFDSLPSSFQSYEPGAMTVRNASIRAGGPLPWALPGGNIALSTQIEHREESLSEVRSTFVGFDLLTPARAQSVDSIYLETQLPLVSARNAVRGVELLEFQLALRRDEYRVTGTPTFMVLDGNTTSAEEYVREDASTDPTIGLRFKPAPNIMLRTSYGTGYRPPAVTELAPLHVGTTDVYERFTDPIRGGEQVGLVTETTGGNFNLNPEISESWSAGLVLTPRMFPGLRISADWSRIAKVDNIESPPLFTQQAFEEFIRVAPHRITRGTPSDGFDVGPITAIDSSLINIARMRVEAVDAKLDYRVIANQHGTFDLAIGATRLVSLETQAISTEPEVENAGVLSVGLLEGGVEWRANASLTWEHESWSLGWRTYFFGPYFLNLEHSVHDLQGASTVPSQIYHDVFGSFRFPSSAARALDLLADMEVQFGINNVFNKKPPLDVVTSVGGYSSFGDPRLANYYLRIRKGFGSH